MIDPLRHLSVFKPEAFGQRRVDVVGCGATGSRIAMSLAKLGVKNIHIWDFDTVEEHNCANQAFGWRHVGKPKVQALAEMLKEDVLSDYKVHAERVDGSQSLGEVVFLLTDTMGSRKEIWDKSIKLQPRTRIMIETRMGVDNGRIYAINPCSLDHIRRWEATLYTDSEAEVSACGGRTSVGPTAEVIAGIAVWRMICWAREEEIENETIFQLRPTTTFITNKF